MEPLLLHPDPPPPALVQALELAGYPWKAVATSTQAQQHEPEEGWSGAVIVADGDPEAAFALCRALRKRDVPLEPLMLLLGPHQLRDLELREDLFDDFCVQPFQPNELDARLKHLFWRAGRGTRPELVRDTLGDHIFEWFLRNKRAEWADYKAQVTPFELARYLPTW